MGLYLKKYFICFTILLCSCGGSIKKGQTVKFMLDGEIKTGITTEGNETIGGKNRSIQVVFINSKNEVEIYNIPNESYIIKDGPTN